MVGYLDLSHNDRGGGGGGFKTDRAGGDREKELMADTLAAWKNIDQANCAVTATKDQGLWKDVVANALMHGACSPPFTCVCVCGRLLYKKSIRSCLCSQKSATFPAFQLKKCVF